MLGQAVRERRGHRAVALLDGLHQPFQVALPEPLPPKPRARPRCGCMGAGALRRARQAASPKYSFQAPPRCFARICAMGGRHTAAERMQQQLHRVEAEARCHRTRSACRSGSSRRPPLRPQRSCRQSSAASSPPVVFSMPLSSRSAGEPAATSTPPWGPCIPTALLGSAHRPVPTLFCWSAPNSSAGMDRARHAPARE